MTLRRLIPLVLAACVAGFPRPPEVSGDTQPPPRSPYVTGAFAKGEIGGMRFRIHGTQAMLDSGRAYPLLLILHGTGERGDDNEAQLRHGAADFASARLFSKHPCFIVVPQCPAGTRWDAIRLAQVRGILETLLHELPVDRTRLYLTGYSMGGDGVWALLEDTPERFAAAIPIAGRGDVSRAASLRSIPLRIFHTTLDTMKPVALSRDMCAAIRAAGGRDCRLTEWGGDDHNCWTDVYPDPALSDWLFAQKRRESGRIRPVRTPFPVARLRRAGDIVNVAL